MTARKKKSAREKRVAIASIIVAATIVAGSTFAWFTSQDEVTNRLTAHADYGVSIVEDFKPPEDWVPGQEINKDVSAVNTGNVDAYVRLGLLYDSKMTVAGEGVAVPANAEAASSADKTKWVELKKTAVDKQEETSSGNAVNATANEVTLLQAGGTLVYAAGSVVTPSNAQNVKSGDDSSQTDYSGTEQYKPKTTGLYLFQRTIYETADSISTPVTKYSGYYYVAKDGTDNGGQGTYYALVTEPDTVYTAGIAANAFTTNEAGKVTMATNALNEVKLANTNEVTISNKATDANAAKFDVTWIKATDSNEAGNTVGAGNEAAKYIRLTYAGNNNNEALDDVIIDIKLDDNWTTNWAYIDKANGKVDGTNDTGYFYYKKTLAPGATTPKLVESVTLNKEVTDEAYKDLVFDLSVVLDSIQITPDEAKTATSYVTGVNGAGWGVEASYNKDTGAVTWTVPNS